MPGCDTNLEQILRGGRSRSPGSNMSVGGLVLTRQGVLGLIMLVLVCGVP